MNNRLYVANLLYETSEQEIRDFVQRCAKVESVKMINDRDSGRFRGFAFVEVATDADAKKAIAELNGQDLGGRAITVAEAEQKQRDGRRSGGGRPGGGSGKRERGNGRSGNGGGSGNRRARDVEWGAD